MCFVHGQAKKSEQKPTTKKFVRFHNHSPLLTMAKASAHLGAISRCCLGDVPVLEE